MKNYIYIFFHIICVAYFFIWSFFFLFGHWETSGFAAEGNWLGTLEKVFFRILWLTYWYDTIFPICVVSPANQLPCMQKWLLTKLNSVGRSEWASDNKTIFSTSGHSKASSSVDSHFAQYQLGWQHEVKGWYPVWYRTKFLHWVLDICLELFIFNIFFSYPSSNPSFWNFKETPKRCDSRDARFTLVQTLAWWRVDFRVARDRKRLVKYSVPF